MKPTDKPPAATPANPQSAIPVPQSGAGEPTALPAPVFDPATAKRVPARRHDKTGRTVAHEQPGDGAVHLFSVTGVFVATETAAETDARTKAEAEAKAAEEAAAKAAAQKSAPSTPAA